MKKQLVSSLAVAAALSVGLVSTPVFAATVGSTNGVVNCDGVSTITLNFDVATWAEVKADVTEILGNTTLAGTCAGAKNVVISATDATWALGDIDTKLNDPDLANLISGIGSLSPVETISVKTGDINEAGVAAIAKIAEKAVSLQAGGTGLSGTVKVSIEANSVDLANQASIPTNIVPYLKNISFKVDTVKIPANQDPNIYFTGITLDSNNIVSADKTYVEGENGNGWVVYVKEETEDTKTDGKEAPDSGLFSSDDQNSAMSSILPSLTVVALAGSVFVATKKLSKKED
ncbi:MAG: hypothetical protein LBE03_01025 [Candidatus Nomurabacteria bacterium]|jgi:hypothetical protein|nr:hypothetical protein [Candidatus Nomurabacteria bacterium]